MVRNKILVDLLMNNFSRRAPDDTPLLPITPKNVVYENPFITDKSSMNKTSNSNEDPIEK
jgi:hypothetical protein